MRFVRVASCALILWGTPAAIAQQSTSQTAASSLTDLTGLWQAKRWFGPEVKGPLIIERTPF